MPFTHDLIVIGAGAAGLTAAGGAAMFGLRPLLIEQGDMGGDCLNTGCVPSKAILAAAARAQTAREGDRLGVTLDSPKVDFSAVMAHVHGAIAAIAPVDSQERFEAMGVEVIRARAMLIDDRTVEANGRRFSAPRIVIATGSYPHVPDLPGLADVPYLTNENLWALDQLPEHLAILGGGPIGMEMAQAFRRLGAEVTVIVRGRAMGRDDSDAAALVIDALCAEGVTVESDTRIVRVETTTEGITLLLEDQRRITATHLLVATGRTANVTGYGLENAAVHTGHDGIIVDKRRRTTNKRIYAIGDCRAGPRFTHVSGYEGSLAVLNIVLGLPSSTDFRAMPRVTYTEPELAQVGLTEAEARKTLTRIEVNRADFSHNDRAIAEGRTAGFIKIVRSRGKVVGVTIIGEGAGDLLLPWSTAIMGKPSAFALGSAVIAYPTRSEISKTAAFAAYEGKVFTPLVKGWARFLAKRRRWG